jgi:two-component system KDP operon response regulator KdpE
MQHLAAISNEGALLLLVEDELNARKFLRITLRHNGYRLLEAATGSAGLELARTEKPALVLLDLGLPDMDGCEVSRRIRKSSGIPIIVISARSAEEQKIAALDDGADDYVTKPFSPNELLARIRVALRRSPNAEEEPEAKGIFEIGELQVDFEQRRVVSRGREVRLTPTEYKLLSVLIDSAGRVVTHRRLLQRVWGISGSDHVNYLRVYMRQLRNKLEPAPATPRYLLTEPAVGYRLRLRD